MLNIAEISQIEDKKNIAILDTSSISFMQMISFMGIAVESILEIYDLILIPGWVLMEIQDSAIRVSYVESLVNKGLPIYTVAEEKYTELVDYEEGNLYQIVLASTALLGRLRSYLRRFVEKSKSIDMDEYSNWITKLYSEWPLSEQILGSGRVKKKNAGEVSITILAEVISWYYPDTESLTVYSQDRDAFEFQRKAEDVLWDVFESRTPVHVSYKSNDAVLCQLYREGKVNEKAINELRKDQRRIIYSKVHVDYSVSLSDEIVDNELFIELIKDETVQIVF